MALYEIILLGQPSEKQERALGTRFAAVGKEFGLEIPADLNIIRDASAIAVRNPKAATVALYFGGDNAVDLDVVSYLTAAKVPVVPVVAKGSSVAECIPSSISSVNAAFVAEDDETLEALASVALEIIGLLHRQRRVFVSYRRTESRDVGIQLHDELSSRGFSVFLDTHDIRPGAEFQEMLWHDLADCDVMIMLDTIGYFESKWTKQELGRSLALGVQILRLVWPGHSGSRHLSLSDTVTLQKNDLDASHRLIDNRINEIVKRAELLRSRSIATRQLEIIGKLRIEVERIGGKFEGIGAHRAIGLTLPHGKTIDAYPVVGVPTAAALNDIHVKSSEAGHGRFPCLVYDHIGIRPAWLQHLEWLDSKISDVRALKVYGAGWELVTWDN